MPAPKRLKGDATIISLYLLDEQIRALQYIAVVRTLNEGRRVTVSEMIREAVDAYIRDQVAKLNLQLPVVTER